MGYLHYQRDLEFNAIEKFLEDLSKKLTAISEAEDKGTYTPFAEKFEIKTVTPRTVSLTSEDFILENIKEINRSISIINKEIFKNSNKEESSIDKRISQDTYYKIRIIPNTENFNPFSFLTTIPTEITPALLPYEIENVSEDGFTIKSKNNPLPYFNLLKKHTSKIYSDGTISISKSFKKK